MEKSINEPKPVWEHQLLKLFLVLLIFAFILYKSGLKPVPQGFTGPIDSLAVGAVVPPIPVSYLDSSMEPGNLHDFKGKLVILTFFSMSCIPCVYQFPKLDKLQQEFNRDLKFIPMIAAYTPAEEKEVREFYQKWVSQYKAIRSAFAMENVLTLRCFPKETLPQYVWISPEGKIEKITSFEQVTRENIRGVLDKYCLPFHCYKGNGIFL
jgi:thiol-disulfide isomerase/thioredoxin